MNKFDRAVNKKATELITKNMLGQEVTEEDIKKYTIIARALIRQELRGLKPNDNERSLYNKTWKAAKKFGEFKQ
ncbi:hypothetical protein [Clostridium thermarum]|uniref:hypothetical protein n=1 Tax=Clostridium thermarum TaxID=1716543 RepID=UPI00111DA4FF|nr:hypothetical protein [Clostridium thermarum]